MRLRFLLAAYGAAAISFLASLLRDYSVINFSNQDKQFFQLLYVASMAAGFGVNAIALGRGVLGKGALLVLALLGVVVIFALLPAPDADLNTVALLVSILLLWIAGARWSRALMEHGNVFSGRVREAISSVVLAGLVVAGLGVQMSFLMAVAAGTVFSWTMWRLARPTTADPGRSGNSLVDIRNLIQNVFLTNIATFSITYWALVQTGKMGDVFGFEISTAVRFAMYIYQILTIGSVVLVSPKYKLNPPKRLGLLISVAASVFIAALFIPLQAALVLIPLSAGVTHYGVVLFLQRNPIKRG